MTISVIIPVYKVEKYIRRCLESVIRQENNDYKIECLIIDDGSPDKSIEIVNEIVNNYKGTAISFIVISHKENLGLSMARNTGIKASTGDYLFFIDSDDELFDNAFRILYSFLLEYPIVDVIMGNSILVGQNDLSNTYVMNGAATPYLIDERKQLLDLVLRRRLNRNVWNKLIRRSLVIDNNLFFDLGLLYEDVTWTYRLYSCISSILIVPEITYKYEYNPTSIVHTPAKRSRQMIWSFAFISDYILNNPPLIRGRKALFAAHCLFVNHWMLKAIDLNNKYGVDPITKQKLTNLKKRLLWRSVSHVRLIMFFYFLVMFKPLSSIMNLRCFRANVDRISRLVFFLS